MDSFELLLKNDKLNSYNKIGYLVCSINFIFFIFYAFNAKQGYASALWVLFSILIPAFCFAEVSIRKKLAVKNNLSVTYCWLIVLWFGINIYMAIVHALLLLFDIITKRELRVSIDTNGIGYPSFPKKNIPWDVLTNVVLKDGLLTIDFKDNHLLQAETDATQSQVNETMFNNFCQQQLNHL